MDSKSGGITPNNNAIVSFQTISYLISLWLVYRILLALYNISPLHPLSRFPGPKIAAASYVYEAYYDWWRVGRYGKEIRRMHERYGPIVRINPDELHCSDPYFTDEIYAGPGRIRDKWQHQLNTGGAGPVSVTGFSTVNHEVHRMRKGALSKYFSRQQMLKLEGEMNVVIPGYIEAALKNPEGGRVFADMVESKLMLESEKSMYRMSGEGFNFLLAGTEITAATVTVITYYLLAQPLAYRRLMADLEGLDKDNLKWTDLEQRSYLWAVIHEALRVMPGVSHRSARIAREEDLIYKSRDGNIEWFIPRGTPIGMTSMINHWDKEIFPNPDEFIPERWLENGKPNYKLQKLLIAFGKGSRACIGENLAYCEVYIMAAMLALRVIPRARLYETTIEDITYDHDLIVVQTKKGSISVRITVE
ncbi:hypothetical protein FSARC_10553 [Fusarium sarcochroum]|uniref:Cytochrome P450 monooxygenase n=1 Tax=Fusarium sarcochroum TaxID=1208366 RepID=A0A8H4TL42_9HYPO|nr:hypothetical protein FSARC_10553 [Fusarium sarcochroum]